MFVANIPDREVHRTLHSGCRRSAGTDPLASDAMVNTELGALHVPVELTVRPMRCRMVTIGLRVPLPEKVRVVDEDHQT